MIHIKKVLTGVVYDPSNANDSYWDLLEIKLEKARYLGIDTIFLTGDFNCNLLVPNSKLIKILDNFHFEQLIKEATRIVENNSTLLDIIATTSADL